MSPTSTMIALKRFWEALAASGRPDGLAARTGRTTCARDSRSKARLIARLSKPSTRRAYLTCAPTPRATPASTPSRQSLSARPAYLPKSSR